MSARKMTIGVHVPPFGISLNQFLGDWKYRLVKNEGIVKEVKFFGRKLDAEVEAIEPDPFLPGNERMLSIKAKVKALPEGTWIPSVDWDVFVLDPVTLLPIAHLPLEKELVFKGFWDGKAYAVTVPEDVKLLASHLSERYFAGVILIAVASPVIPYIGTFVPPDEYPVHFFLIDDGRSTGWVAMGKAKVKGPYINVIGIKFWDMPGWDNEWDLYDRPNRRDITDPIWVGEVKDGKLTQVKNDPACYVRSGGFIRKGPQTGEIKESKILLRADVFSDTVYIPKEGILVEVSVEGELNNKTFNFSPKTYKTLLKPNEWKKEDYSDLEFISDALPDVVNINQLKLYWKFRTSIDDGQTWKKYPEQTTPSDPEYHKIYTTFSQPLDTGLYFLIKSPAQGIWVSEFRMGIPVHYIEILQWSCDWAEEQSKESHVIKTIFDGCWNLGEQGYKYKLEYPEYFKGLDGFLVVKYGRCAEWAHFLKALFESQGIDVWTTGFSPDLKQSFTDYKSFLPAVGASPPPQGWKFANHGFVMLKDGTVYDPTFHKICPSWREYEEIAIQELLHKKKRWIPNNNQRYDTTELNSKKMESEE